MSTYPQATDPLPALLSGPEARRISGGISEATQRRLIAKGDYPRPVTLFRDDRGRPTRVAWVEAEVREWVARRIASGRFERVQ